jgi:hypothetical protein
MSKISRRRGAVDGGDQRERIDRFQISTWKPRSSIRRTRSVIGQLGEDHLSTGSEGNR